MRIALVGFPRSGKTSLFNLLTGQQVATTVRGARGELHLGVARVPDERVLQLSALFRPRKTTLASFEVVDLAGIEKGEHRGLQAQEFRSADALLHVVRAFPDAAGEAPRPAGDVADLETELILADLEVVERRLERLEASLRKRPTPGEQREQALLARVKPHLEAGEPLRALPLEPEDARVLKGFTFLSAKPILHCLNLDEKAIPRAATLAESYGLGEVAASPATRVGWVSALLEAEVAALQGEEQAAFLAELGLPEPALTRVLRDCYDLLGLVSFFTVGEDEVRAWSVPRGTRAQDAAQAIHSDLGRGFIRAEVVRWDDLVAAGGSMAVARERGLLRLEGKDYPVQDGEVCHIRFSVAR